jgi:hypothetical protein
MECTQFFSGLFSKHDVDEAPALPPGGHLDEPNFGVLNDHVTEHKVGAVLRTLCIVCSSGTNGVPAENFKFAVHRDRSGRVYRYRLTPHLAQLFDWCFQQGTAPDDWGLALLTMIHKGGATTDWGNHRPIAVSCVGCLQDVCNGAEQ